MLQSEVFDAKLSPEQNACFRKLLVDVATSNGHLGTMERKFIEHMFEDVEVSETLAGQESLWNYSELLLKSAITISVMSGRYPIEQARRVSQLAQFFGVSARKLRVLEEQSLRAIQFKGQQFNAEVAETLSRTLESESEPTQNSQSQSETEVSYSDFMRGLWQSDADLIQHTEYDPTQWDDED